MGDESGDWSQEELEWVRAVRRPLCWRDRLISTDIQPSTSTTIVTIPSWRDGSASYPRRDYISNNEQQSPFISFSTSRSLQLVLDRMDPFLGFDSQAGVRGVGGGYSSSEGIGSGEAAHGRADTATEFTTDGQYGFFGPVER